MAITKNHPIDTSLKKAIDYICNPHKTDEEIYIYSYGCSPATADIEFMWTQNNENASIPTAESHLARHFIQSFDPGETTPEVAHEIGKRLAEEVFGKYEYVLATHTDRGHIHNHIIVNDVSFVDYKRSHINEKWYYKTRKISDNLCKEFGLSVITPSNNKGKSYKERAVINKGISWKMQLQNTIDVVIPKSKDFDDFIMRMELAGYKVKRQNKNISFCADGRERYTRSKTLGEDYTIDAIIERIKGKDKSTMLGGGKRVSLLIDIQNCIKAQQSKGYEHWAKINNIKQTFSIPNFTVNSFTSAITSSVIPMLNICIFVIFFSVISSSIENILSYINFNTYINTFISGFLELTNGINNLSYLPLNTKTVFLSAFFVGWSGISVILQSISIFSKHALDTKKFIISKFSQGIICALLCEILCKFFKLY